AAELKDRIGQVKIIDTRSRSSYAAGHIPGAHWVDAAEWGRAFDKAQDAADWGARFGRTRLTTDVEVVVYGGDDVRDAARIWWILRFWGVKKVRLLNGGWSAWTAAQGATTKDVPEPG